VGQHKANAVFPKRPNHVEIRTAADVHVDHRNDSWIVTDANSTVESEQVVVTTPAWAGSDLLAAVNPEASELLASITYSSVGLLTLVFAPGSFNVGPEMSGVLVPRAEGHTVTAISFASNKWPDELSRDRQQVLRVSVGRREDQAWMNKGEEELLATVLEDLAQILNTNPGTPEANITPWRQSLPQYDLGHREKVAAIDRAAAKTPGLLLTGAWRDGLGLPACVAAGESVPT